MSTTLNLTELRAGSAADLAQVNAIMQDAFDPRYGEAWTSAQCMGMLSLPGVWLTIATIAGRIVGREIRLGSVDIDLQATGQIGDAGTELVILDVDGGDNGPLDTAPPPFLGLNPDQFTVIGGTAQGPGYTLTNAEAGRIRAGILRILVPALATAPGRTPDLIIRDLTVNGGGAAAGLGNLQVISPGIARVEGNVLMADARTQDGLLLNARERLEVVTPTASVRVRDGNGAPDGYALGYERSHRFGTARAAGKSVSERLRRLYRRTAIQRGDRRR